MDLYNVETDKNHARDCILPKGLRESPPDPSEIEKASNQRGGLMGFEEDAVEGDRQVGGIGRRRAPWVLCDPHFDGVWGPWVVLFYRGFRTI
jgi:hypothetical protein